MNKIDEQNERQRFAGQIVPLLLACALIAMLALAFNTTDLSISRSLSNAKAKTDAASSVNSHREIIASTVAGPDFNTTDIPPYEGKPDATLNGNAPWFTAKDMAIDPLDTFEMFSRLDSLGRCGTAVALVGPETMPTEPRESIGMVKPSGWHTERYDWVDGGYLYNRCHLIGYQLTGQNSNELNLITGTRSMNVQGMEPYEDRVASYVNRTGSHVLYRVTPVFEDDNLVATGVIMEAQSLEDSGTGLRFCAWCFNVEPGVVIDYATGNSHADGSRPESKDAGNTTDEQKDGNVVGTVDTGSNESASASEAEVRTYVLNTNTHRFHYPDCPSVSDMKEKNKKFVEMTRDEIIGMGYRPCGSCQP